MAKQPNSIMVVDYPENVEKVRQYLEMIDRGMSSRIFRLKYISAKEIVGDILSSQSGDETEEPVEDVEVPE